MSQLTRRGFLAAPFFIRNLISAPPSSKVRLASFGAGGMAWATLDGIATHAKVELVAVADVDTQRTSRVRQKYAAAQHYQDWREMLAKHHKDLDAVCVGTPDHMHAPQAMASMRHGLHVYCQKPLTSHVAESRALTEYARKKNLITQMGIQIHSHAEYRIAVHEIQAGTIGKVKEVHAWSSKKWGDSAPIPQQTDPVPSNLNWDSWIGVGRLTPFIKDYYHPGNWRKRLEFGTGTFGDMGCHIYDPVFGALGVTGPLSVRAEGPAPNANSWAINAIVKYVFPGTPFTEGKTVAVTWYDGDERPPQAIQSLLDGTPMPDQGSIFIGTKGVMVLPHVGYPIFLPKASFDGYKRPDIKTEDHYHQWVEAILGNGKPSANFDYSGPLSETVLLGSLATRFPNTTLEWDSRKLRFRNEKGANAFLRRKYREGWKVKGIG
jgi:predicted dehydrogenase